MGRYETFSRENICSGHKEALCNIEYIWPGRRRLLKRLVSLTLVLLLLCSMFTGLTVFAAVTPINIYVDSYDTGTLNIHWDGLVGVQAAVLTYHTPDSSNLGQLQTVTLKQTDNKATITGLKADYIYDLEVAVYDTVDGSGNPTGSPVGRGLLFYLPKITFNSSAPDQTYDSIPGGGREAGSKPKLVLKWKIPRVWQQGGGGSGSFELASDTNQLTYMQIRLNAIYTSRELTTLNYRINISSDLNTLNSGSAQTALIINQESGGLTAYVSGNTSGAAVTLPDPNDYVSFQLWGRSDTNSQVPTTSDPNVLRDGDLLPGSVYYMNIKPIFKNHTGSIVNAVTVGNTSDQNGSLLSDAVSYAFTPIRFQITKDSSNNIYIKIYKINQGSLDLPRLFYQVQASDDPSIQGDWTIKKSLDDSYFSGDYAVTVISGVNPNNEIYYKIVVKSDSPTDRIESLKLPYTLQVDTSRPPLPTSIAITDMVSDTDIITTPQAITVKSTDITISWDKPLNWDSLNKKDLYFHFMFSMSQSDMTVQAPLYVGDTYLGSFASKFRLVRYVSASSPNIESVGNRLYYKIKGFDLFKYEGLDENGNATSGDLISDGYPKFLLPNTVYYLQMYSTASDTDGGPDFSAMSDKSIITSFTTLNGVPLDVPLPKNFRVDKNNVVSNNPPPPASINNIELMFDKVSDIDWKEYTTSPSPNDRIYYDLYMSSRTADDSFIKIGSTQPGQNGEVSFIGTDDPSNNSIRAKISKFTDPTVRSYFGDMLKPNTTYYFKIETRLHLYNGGVPIDDLTSIPTAIMPVTTVNISVNPPDDNARKPLAPSDFAIDVGADGNPVLNGSSVTFTWGRQENDVVYELIRTTQKIGPNDQRSTFTSDPEYVSFLNEYDEFSDGRADGFIYLNPSSPVHPDKLIYDPSTKTVKYIVDRRMFPNKLYYFSLKAVRLDTHGTAAAESAWVSIPVTTTLIQAPSYLEVVKDAQLGFYWTADTSGTIADDYSIYIKGPKDLDYKALSRSQSTIIGNTDGRTFFGRATGLDFNTAYSIRVLRGSGSGAKTVFDQSGMMTRDSSHEIEIKWRGTPVDGQYSYYEIALMTEGSSEYLILDPSDLEVYTNSDGRTLPYYTEEVPQTLNSSEQYFHARINTAKFVLPGGISVHQQLKSNMKYYIKVRAVDIDPTDTANKSYSKYIGPVNTRTDFDQGDYDNTDQENKEKAVFLDKMEDLEKGYYWKIASGNSNALRILLKGDIVSSAIKTMTGNTFTIDMTELSGSVDNSEVYVPASVLKAMASGNKSLSIRTSASDITLRPETIDTADDTLIKGLLSKPSVKDMYLKLDIEGSGSPAAAVPAGTILASQITDLGVQALGTSKSDTDLKQLIHDRLYDKDTGLVSENLNVLQNVYVGSGPDAAGLIDEYTRKIIELIQSEMSDYIDSTMKASLLSSAMQDITSFNTPASASLAYNDRQGAKLPYVLYDGASAWQKVKALSSVTGSIDFNVQKTGKYAILAVQSSITDVADGYWAKDSIDSFTSKYDLSDVFTGINSSFMPDNRITGREMVLLYEKVTGRTSADAGLDIKQKTVKLGLDGIIAPNSTARNIERQQAAGVLIRLFSVKKGLEAASLKTGSVIYITDDADIDDTLYKQVALSVDMKIMSLDEDGRFTPTGSMTRAEAITAFVQVLKLTGDL